MRSLLFLLLFVPLWAQDFVPGRYIVELTEEPAVQAATRTARRARIATQQRAVESALRARGLRINGRVEIVANAIVVEAPDEAALAGLPGVKAIHRVRRFRPVLAEHELDIHQTRDAWSLAGGDAKAGEGMKIAILDSGIDVTHPAFTQSDLPAPEGYPRMDREANRQFTSNKIIVARSYERDVPNAFDRDGHGTAVASVAAAAPHTSVAGFFAGVAPRAWLGAYTVIDSEGFYPSDNILRALEDAIIDGMDVVNMSFGSPGAGLEDLDTMLVFDRCLQNGLILVRSAGNTPGAMTVDDDASYERVIAVGATQNSRLTAAAAVLPSQGASVPAGASSNSGGVAPISGPLFDVSTLGDPEGCGLGAEGTLTAKIPIVRRGTCFFYEKILGAQKAGAPAAIIYNSPNPSDGGSPEDIINMDLSSATEPITIPALFIGNANGRRLLESMKSIEDFSVQLRFGDVPNDAKLAASFTSQGPGMNLNIKPDLVAVGSLVTAAVPTGFCDLCADSGYRRVSGTSFSGPYVVGAAAVLKGHRKNLTVDDYRSLLINSTTSADSASGAQASVMTFGGGLLNLKNALDSTLAAAPVSLTFRSGGSTVELSRKLTIKNLSAEPSTITLAVESANEAKAVVSPEALTLGGGESAIVSVDLRGSNLADGAYQGFVVARNSLNGVATRVPYWYAVKTVDTPKSIVVVDVDESAIVGSTGRALVRVHDSAGLALGDFEPRVTPLTIGAEVVSVVKSTLPSTWRVTVRPGRAGTNSFRVEAGDASTTFSITGR